MAPFSEEGGQQRTSRAHGARERTEREDGVMHAEAVLALVDGDLVEELAQQLLLPHELDVAEG